MSAFGQSVENSLADERLKKLRVVGLTCRCVPCCCEEGRGHKHPAWIAYEAEERARERYEDALTSGLSDHEAREEGWPSDRPAE